LNPFLALVLAALVQLTGPVPLAMGAHDVQVPTQSRVAFSASVPK
jgi:hypothetical protein